MEIHQHCANEAARTFFLIIAHVDARSAPCTNTSGQPESCRVKGQEGSPMTAGEKMRISSRGT